jgi:hypothetical protein
MSKPAISFIIQSPSPDLDTPEYEGNKIYIRGAVHSLDSARAYAPDSVINFVQRSFDDVGYRVEILDGVTMYKFYKQPSAEQWPRQEEDTPLEKFQREHGLAGDTPIGIKTYGTFINHSDGTREEIPQKGGAGSGPPQYLSDNEYVCREEDELSNGREPDLPVVGPVTYSGYVDTKYGKEERHVVCKLTSNQDCESPHACLKNNGCLCTTLKDLI